MKTGFIGAAALALSGGIAVACGQAAGPKGPAEKQPIDLEPGTWRSEITMVESRGLPALLSETPGRMAALSGRDRCMPVEAARNANLHDTLTRGPWRGGDCSFSRRSVTDAGVDIAMNCTGLTESHRLETTVTGTASPRKSDLVIENRSRNPLTGGEMYEKYRVVSTWRSAGCKPRDDRK